MNAILSGQRALVTAGASGIGLAIARQLTAAGARCVVCDVDDAALAAYAAQHGPASVVHADVSDADQVDRMFAHAEQQLGGLDILVNNAGVSGPTAPLEQVSLEDWRRTLAVNLDGHFLCTRRAIALLRAAGGGSIVNMSSIGGRLGYPNRAAYASAKWGIVGFTKTMSMELGPSGIRVNAILPAMVLGPRLDRVMAERAERTGVPLEEVWARALNKLSLRRGTQASDVAALTVFLASEGGRNISGQAIPVDSDATSLG
jgi:NAD(P)-dependent dehydrogenase (short-subunit alcohol dehydrogenase family)